MTAYDPGVYSADCFSTFLALSRLKLEDRPLLGTQYIFLPPLLAEEDGDPATSLSCPDSSLLSYVWKESQIFREFPSLEDLCHRPFSFVNIGRARSLLGVCFPSPPSFIP